jgi:3-deoxy-manno-octulosonate cytidylyltransferase (CMP-KDO synthetase)
MTQTAIIIPARYASTRFPGKPLALIAGRTMIERVADIARAACDQIPGAQFAVATEDQRIIDFCAARNIPAVITDDTCKTGTDRVAMAVRNLGLTPDIVLGLQGDAPFTPLSAVTGVIEALLKNPQADVATPVVKLRWPELDRLRENKKTTPFSGTTCVMDASGRALWFSKNIIPAMRKESGLRDASEFSPIHQHLGLYGYRYNALQKFIALPEGVYEKLEGLEQLRLIENGMHVQAAPLNIDLGLAQSGVDSPEDITRAEETIAKYGEPLKRAS